MNQAGNDHGINSDEDCVALRRKNTKENLVFSARSSENWTFIFFVLYLCVCVICCFQVVTYLSNGPGGTSMVTMMMVTT